MKINLSGFHVLITGASSGLGFEMAKALLQAGAAVGAAARPTKRLEAACEKLSAYGEVFPVPMDVRDEASVRLAAEKVREKFGHLDMLVNNAGVGNNVGAGMNEKGETPQIFDIPTKAFTNIVETNFTGYFLVTKYFVPMMAEAGKGRLVYVSTSDGTMKMKGQIPYGPARAAAEAMAFILAQELPRYGLTVNVICPGGATDTGMCTEKMREFFKKSGRTMLPPSVMNDTILFLASPEAEKVNGEKIVAKEFEAWCREKGFRA